MNPPRPTEIYQGNFGLRRRVVAVVGGSVTFVAWYGADPDTVTRTNGACSLVDWDRWARRSRLMSG